MLGLRRPLAPIGTTPLLGSELAARNVAAASDDARDGVLFVSEPGERLIGQSQGAGALAAQSNLRVVETPNGDGSVSVSARVQAYSK